MSVISQGFDYRPEEVLCSQAVRKAAQGPAQAPQPVSQLTTTPVIADTDNSLVKVLNAHISLRDVDHHLQVCNRYPH